MKRKAGVSAGNGAGGVTLPDRLYRRALAAATTTVVEPLLGTRYLSLSRQREQWWTLSCEERDRWRADRLERLLDYTGRHVRAYRDLPADLDRLPVIDKQVIIDRFEDFLSDEHERQPVVWKHTGGSTGDPWNYPLDRRAWAESYATQIYRYRGLGVDYGDRRLLLGFPASLGLHRMGWSRRLRMLAERTHVALSSLEVDKAASLTRAVAAARLDARMWYGYASTIAQMAAAVLDSGTRLSGPPLIVTMAEPLWPDWHRDITEAFGSTVVEEYGCNDGGIMAHRCRAGNLHLADHQSIVEVLDDDGAPCPPGRAGDIVITNLHARHLPFIRYRAGDIGVLGPDPCPCDQPGRTLAAVTGRSGDYIRLPNGTELVPAAFFIPFNQIEGVRRWQMIQPDPSELVIRIEPRPSWTAQERDTILAWVRDRTADQLAVRLTTDEPFELTPGGKHRIVVRKF